MQVHKPTYSAINGLVTIGQIDPKNATLWYNILQIQNEKACKCNFFH